MSTVTMKTYPVLVMVQMERLVIEYLLILQTSSRIPPRLHPRPRLSILPTGFHRFPGCRTILHVKQF